MLFTPYPSCKNMILNNSGLSTLFENHFGKSILMPCLSSCPWKVTSSLCLGGGKYWRAMSQFLPGSMGMQAGHKATELASLSAFSHTAIALRWTAQISTIPLGFFLSQGSHYTDTQLRRAWEFPNLFTLHSRSDWNTVGAPSEKAQANRLLSAVSLPYNSSVSVTSMCSMGPLHCAYN